ncbi:hypothetical protein OPV09_15910 [Janthinobacterium sp. TB1-E2]|nr:hypothetical protein [Janthinobacterium lividum]
MSAMAGLLTQTLANLLAAQQQIAALGGLPPAAQQIQAGCNALIQPMVMQTRTLQQAVAAFVQAATPQLAQVQSMLSAQAPLPDIKAAMSALQQQARQLQGTANGTAGTLTAQTAQLMGYFNQLAGVEAGLQSQVTALQGQLGDAQSELDAAQKRYYYLLALGPFGLVGLAVALGLYLKWKSDVSDLQGQIGGLNGQIGAFNGMKAACQQLGADCQGLAASISDVRNAVNFLVSDLLEVSGDLDAGDAAVVIALMATAASTELATLGTDAA